MKELLLPLSIVASALVLGVVAEKIILKRLRRLAERTKWQADDLLLDSLQGFLFFWSLLAGLHISLLSLPLKPSLLPTLQKIITILYILSLTIFLSRVSVRFFRASGAKSREALPSASIFENLIRVFIFLLGFMMILHSLGISIAPILTALGVGGLAVALALQDTLSNLFSGLHILVSRQIRPGDYIKLSTGEEGYVEDITWRNTTIRQLPNNLVIVPNAKLATTIVTNYHLPARELAVRVEVGVSYDSDLEKVERVTIEVAKEVMQEVPGGVAEFEPLVRYHTFADSSIAFSVILRAREFTDQYLVKHEFVKRLHRRYREEGIVIPYPIRTVYLKKEEEKA